MLGVFVSYIGLFSYYNFDNWTYQPSFVSSNTPWFFNGLRVQWWPTQTLKIEPWLINGWQSYAKFNSKPGFGGQILWIPNDSLKLVFNSYSIGQDNLNCQASSDQRPVPWIRCVSRKTAATRCVRGLNLRRRRPAGQLVAKGHAHPRGRQPAGEILRRPRQGRRRHIQDGLQLHGDIGCEYGGGVTCTNGQNKENFFGMMLYDRTWFNNDLYAVTFGGGFMNNPGRYLALTPPINGATAQSGSPYFTQQPGQKLYQWDTQLNFQYMPKDWITWWTEATFRHSSVPYWTGIGRHDAPGRQQRLARRAARRPAAAGGQSRSPASAPGDWFPDLREPARSRPGASGAPAMVKF
jgi:hypothetical protein